MATSFSYYIFVLPDQYTETTGPDRSISWEHGTAVQSTLEVHAGPDGVLSTGGADWFISTFVPYTGYTFDFEGNIYAIFRDFRTDILFIPYNEADGDLGAFFDSTPGSTSAYTPAGAQVFNCFAIGTRIATPDGDRTIETIKPGDLVLTHDGRSAPLTVTGDHALLFDDMLINAGTLVNGTTIRLLPLAGLPSMFNYWHVELEEHECIVANGVPAESFIDYVGRSGFDNYDKYLDLAGADRLIAEMPLPRVCAHRLVPPDLREALGIAPPSYMPRRAAA